MERRDMQVFTGTAHPKLAQEITRYLGLPLGDAKVDCFPDGEVRVKVDNDVRGADVFVVQSTCAPANNNLMELLILIDCLRRASASRITAVLPYFGYARQDRKDEGRVPITAKLVANMIARAGADRVLTIDLHAAQIQGFFDIPVDHLFASPVIGEYFQRLNLPNLCLVTSDVGGIKIARAYAKRLKGSLAIVDKRRSGPAETAVMNIIGDVKGKTVLIVDDMIATGGSIVDAAVAVKEQGANDVFLAATHAVMAGNAWERIRKAPIQKLVVTNTIPVVNGDKNLVEVLSIAPMLGEAMRRTHYDQSVSALFT